MKIIEEKFLKSSISKLNKYTKDHRDFLDFFNDLDEVMNESLQDLAFKSDLEFFDEVAFIMSVISSIIAHPHMINKREEIIIRSELAPQISNDMFLKTIKDSKLWIEDGMDYLPEYVYHNQQIDEIKIYENLLIVNLVNIIDSELMKYNDFYVSRIQTVNGLDLLSTKKDHSDIALKRINSLTRRIKHIKNTRFYKELNKSSLKISSIQATNILVKDRLYNYCFKFYKKLLTYTDEMSKIFDIRLYYFVQLVKVLKKKGFMISESNNIEFDTFKNIIIPKVIFTSEVFDVELYPDMDNFGLVINVINNSIKNKSSKKATHLLLFNTKTTFKDFEINDIDDKYNSIDIISLWSVKGYDDISKMITSNELKEIELIEKWLDQKMYVVLGNIDIYSQYCPVCKSSYIEETDTKVYLCLDCNSKYSIYKTKENKNEKIWFIKLRRL